MACVGVKVSRSEAFSLKGFIKVIRLNSMSKNLGGGFYPDNSVVLLYGTSPRVFSFVGNTFGVKQF